MTDQFRRARPCSAVLTAVAVAWALVWVGEVCQAQGSAQAEKDLAFAQGLYGQENYQLAAEKFAAFVRQYPGHANIPLALFRAGECLYRLGRYEEALPYFDQLTRQFPDSAEAEPAWVWLGDTRFQLKQYDRAAAAYAAFVHKYPDSDQVGRAAYWQGESYYHLGQHEDAIAAYRLALERTLGDQEAAYARYAIGWSYLQLKQPDHAIVYLQQVLDRHPASPVAAESQYLLGTAYKARKDYPLALAAFEKVLATHPGSEFAAYAREGIAWCHFEQKAWESALIAFQQVVTDYPASKPAAEAQLRIADCLYHLERWSEAAPIYERIAADRTSKWAAEALYWLARTYERQGDAEAALAAYRRLVAEWPASSRLVDSQLRIGRLEAAAGRPEAAAAAYKAAADAAGEQGDKLQAVVGLAWAKYQQDKSDESLAEVDRLLRQTAQSPMAQELGCQVAYLYYAAGKHQSALDLLETLIASNPRSTRLGEMLYLAGACHDKLGNQAKAEELYQRAIVDGEQTEYAGYATAALVDLCARRGNLDQARSLAEALEKSGASTDARAYALSAIAEALYRDQRHAEAIPFYLRALELAPDGPAAPAAQLGLAWAKLAAGDPTAGEAFRAVAQRYPRSEAARRAPEGLLAVGEKLFAEGKFAEAQEYYQRVVDDFGDSDCAGAAHYKLGWSLLKQEQPELALPHFLQAADKPGLEAVIADARYQAARMLVDQGDFPQASSLLEPFADMYRVSERRPAALALLGRARLELGQHDPAAAVFRMVLDQYPDHPAAAEAWLGMGRIHRKQGHLDQALTALDKALAIATGPTGAEAQYELAACYLDRGDTRRAAEEFLKVAILYPHERWAARAQYEAGQCYEQLQDTDSAIRTYRVVVRDYPTQQQWVDLAQARLKALQP